MPIRIEGGPAKPVVLSTDASRMEGGPAEPIYVIEDPNYRVEGGPAETIVEAPAGMRIAGGPAKPVRILSAGSTTRVAGRRVRYVRTVGRQDPLDYLSWLIRDEFITPLAAGSVNGTAAEPGPGTRAVVDTENKLSITGGQLSMDGKAVPAFGDPVLVLDAIDRSAGRALLYRVKTSYGLLGFDDDNAGIAVTQVFWFNNPDLLARYGDQVVSILNPYDPTATYTCCIVLRSTGAYFLIKGPEFPTWTLVLVDASTTATPMYPNFGAYNNPTLLDYARAADLPGPFAVDYGLPTYQKAGAFANALSYLHNPNCRLEFTVPTVAGGFAGVYFRYTNAQNLLYVYVGPDGTLTVAKIVGGTYSVVDDAAGVVTNGSRIAVVCQGSSVKVYVNGTLTLDLTISEHANVANGIGMAFSTRISDLVTYPIDSEVPTNALGTDWLPGRRAFADGFTHEFDAIVEWEIAHMPNATCTMLMRYSGAKGVGVYVSTDGSGSLAGIDAGVITLDTCAAGSFAEGHRVVVVLDGAIIRVYSNNVLIMDYSGGTVYGEGTNGVSIWDPDTGEIAANIVTWPRRLSGQAEAILNQYSADDV